MDTIRNMYLIHKTSKIEITSAFKKKRHTLFSEYSFKFFVNEIVKISAVIRHFDALGPIDFLEAPYLYFRKSIQLRNGIIPCGYKPEFTYCFFSHV